jgi:hypothetical protein
MSYVLEGNCVIFHLLKEGTQKHVIYLLGVGEK